MSLDTVTLAPGVEVLAPEAGETLRYSGDAVQAVFDFFGLLPFASNEWAGKPFTLLPWQEDAIRSFYGVQVLDEDGCWVRYRQYLYDELPKKQGKSEFAAGLGLYHLTYDGEERPLVGIFAADKNNADIIYQAAKYMVEHSALGQSAHDPFVWCRDSRREIYTKAGGLMKVYSSDADSKHGFSFSAVLFDELHAQPNRRLWDVVTTGSGDARRQPAYIVLTTAGDDPDRTSIGWEIHEKCRRLLNYRKGTPESETDRDDPAWCPIMYGISILTGDDPDRIAELDIYDEELWNRCCPSLGITVKLRTVRQHARRAKQSEAEERLFRWLRLNQWIATKTVGWLPLTLYDKTQWGPSQKAEREDWLLKLRGKRCFGGLDLSSTTDLTAFVLIFPPQEGLDTWVMLPQAWVPLEDIEGRENRDHVPYRDWIRAGFLAGCEGDMIDYRDVAAAVFEANGLYQLEMLGIDQFLSQTLTPLFADKGITTVAIIQNMAGMGPATKELERMIRKREMLHVHNTCARWCVGNARAVIDGNENKKLMKNKSTGRIDIAVAWIIAVAVSMVGQEKPDLSRAMEQDGWSL